MNGSVDEIRIEDIVKFFWKIRKFIIIGVIVLLLILGGNFAFARFQVYYAEGGNFSSANLDRISRGVYRLRVEVFGRREDPNREDVLIDFDRDLNIMVYVYNGLLSLRILNERQDILIEHIHLRGRLRNRPIYDFQQIYVRDSNINLGYNDISRGIPISIFTTNANHELQIENRTWLRELDEFRENFELLFLEVTFLELDDYDDAVNRVVLRYLPASDNYEIRSQESLEISNVYDDYEIASSGGEEYDGVTRFSISV